MLSLSDGNYNSEYMMDMVVEYVSKVQLSQVNKQAANLNRELT